MLQVRAKLFRLDVPDDRLVAITRGAAGAASEANGDAHGANGSSSGDAAAAVTAPSGGDAPAAAGKGKTPEWVEVGIGPVRLLTPKKSLTQTSLHEWATAAHGDGEGDAPAAPRPESARLVMRREDKKGGHGTKLLLNTLLKGYISVAKQGDRMFRITCVSVTDFDGAGPVKDGAGEAASLALRTYMFKTKAQHEADDLFHAISRCVEEERQRAAPAAATAPAATASAGVEADAAPAADATGDAEQPPSTG